MADCSLLFTGDVCVSGSFATRLGQEHRILGKGLQDLIAHRDGTIINLEGAFLPSDSEARINNPIALLGRLPDWKVQAVNLANNHTFDAGVSAFRHTTLLLDQASIPYFGAGETLSAAQRWQLLSIQGIRIALIGLGYAEGPMADVHQAGVHGQTGELHLRRLVEAARAEADHVLISYHGSEEYTREPWPKRRKLMQAWTRYGVSAVVGHHPHVPQGWELVNGVPIFYSLGHFVFDQPHHHVRRFTDEGLIAELRLTKTTLECEVHGIRLDRQVGLVELADSVLPPPIVGTGGAWRSEAYRVMQERQQGKSQAHEQQAESDSALPQRFRLPRFLRRSFYQTIWAYLRSDNTRAVLIGALLHLLLRR